MRILIYNNYSHVTLSTDLYTKFNYVTVSYNLIWLYKTLSLMNSRIKLCHWLMYYIKAWEQWQVSMLRMNTKAQWCLEVTNIFLVKLPYNGRKGTLYTYWPLHQFFYDQKLSPLKQMICSYLGWRRWRIRMEDWHVEFNLTLSLASRLEMYSKFVLPNWNLLTGRANA